MRDGAFWLVFLFFMAMLRRGVRGVVLITWARLDVIIV